MGLEQDDFYNLAERIEDIYTEIDNDICAYLSENNSDYMNIKADVIKLQAAFPVIRDVTEGAGAVSLSPEEHKALIRYLDLKNEMENMERKRIYFRGHSDCFAYLKRIGAI